MFIRHVQQFFFEPMLADHYSSITGSVLSDDSIMMSYSISSTSPARCETRSCSSLLLTVHSLTTVLTRCVDYYFISSYF